MSEFAKSFAETIDRLAKEARAVGMTREGLAAAAGCSSATLRRWKVRPPQTVQTVAKMEAAIAAKRAANRA